MTERDSWTAMTRGWKQCCPACGEGRLYGAYLKVADTCSHCGQELHHQRADDAPPYFTMFIVSHIVVALMLIVERKYSPDVWVHAALWGPMTILMSLWFLPRVKGVLIGQQWAMRMHGFGLAPDPALPENWPPVRVKTEVRSRNV
ncbi:MAG TPA: DUF983 domain-containing protein [Hyphomicrobiaceae bacterium]|nr:DUF983 domain-containing protein [Hyphomicrobiaceae bacterium]